MSMFLMILFLYIVIVLAHFDERLRNCRRGYMMMIYDIVIACLTLGARYCVMLGAVCMPTYAYHNRIVDLVKASKQCLGL